jgi:hypothetical protein
LINFLKNRYFCFISCLFLAFPAAAETVIDASIKLLDFDYEEFDQSGDSFNRENGIIPGLSLSISNIQQGFTNSIAIESFDGTVDYDGQTQSGTPHTTETDETLLRMFYRLDWSPQNSRHSVYGKIAWQQWDRDIQPANNVDGLFEQYSWWAYEAGLSINTPIDINNLLQFELGIVKIDNGEIEIDLNDYGFGRPVLYLGDGNGFNASIRFQHTLINNNRISLGLLHQRWKFGKSNSKIISNGLETFEIYEPRSESKHTIASLDFIFVF